MKKRFFAVIIALIMLMPLGTSAANSGSRFDLLSYLEIMVGYGNGELGLDRLVTRAEFSKMAIEASPLRSSVAEKLKISPFEDVSFDKWYAPYVYLGAVNKIFAGYVDGTFRPDNNVTYEEAVMVALRLFGYSDDEFRYSWPYGPVSTGEKNGLCDGMDAYVGQALTRDQVSHLFYNLMTANNGNSKYITKIGYSIEEDVIISASYKETAAISRGKVYTNKGLLDVSDGFDYSLVGYKGDAVLKDGKITQFFPYGKNMQRYNVFDVSGNNIILYKDGAISDHSLQGSETVYYNMQTATVDSLKQTLSAGDVLDFYYNTAGELDYLIYYKSELDGPYRVKSSGWAQEYGVSSDAVVMRAGEKSSMDSVCVNDIIYYSKNLNTVWAYNDTVTGVYEAAQPNKNNPTSVTVSGKTYTIEGVEAYNELSSNGSIAFGDTVKLLLGKDKQIAGVVSVYDTGEPQTGFVISSGAKNFSDADGRQYTSNYINVILCDGNTYEYRTEPLVSDNQVVRLNFENGKATAKSVNPSKSVSGRFDFGKLTFGTERLSADVEIIEVVQQYATNRILYGKVYPQRLDGVNIQAKSVLYSETDANGAITKLILSDVTGDLYSYGIITKADSGSQGMRLSGSYTYYNGTELTSIVTQGSSFSVYAGNAVKITPGSSQTPYSISKLSEACVVTEITDAMINGVYKRHNGIVAYEKTDDYEYRVIDVNTLKDKLSQYQVTAYDDKNESAGGRIRVLIASKKA